MHRTFPFQDLGTDEFELLVAAVCHHILGTGTFVFATGKDGGRDASFEGTAQYFPSTASPLSGKFVIQAKHTSNPVASCSDAEFSRVLNGEHSKIKNLISNGELEHYLVFTNRKKPATDAVQKEKILKDLGLNTAHIVGIEMMRLWLTERPHIWSNLGFDRFEVPFRIQTEDLTTIILGFHQEMDDHAPTTELSSDFTYVPKPEKNKINKLSTAYFEEMKKRSLPYFKNIEDFLKNPRNVGLKDMYEDTADEIRRKLISTPQKFETFDEALTSIIEHVTANNEALKKRRRFAAVFLHYMYFTCDIGQHADAVQAS